MRARFYSRRREIAAAVILVLGGIVSVGLAAASGGLDPAKSVQVSKAEAVTNAMAFANEAGSVGRAQAPSVADAVTGAVNSFYTVSAEDFFADVDAHDGRVVGFVLAGDVPTTPGIRVNETDALAAAKAFLDAHHVPWSDLEVSVEWRDHGEASEYVVTFTRRQGGVLLPDQRVLGVNASTGKVFRYSDLRREFVPPGKPAIERDVAVAAAIAASGLEKAVSTGEDLQVAFDSNGKQRLVWRISLQAPIDSTDATSYNDYALVEVDAISGVAVVLGRG